MIRSWREIGKEFEINSGLELLSTHFMQLLKCNDDLSNVHASLRLWEAVGLIQVSEELSSLDEVKYEVKFSRCLERVVHRCKEGKADDLLKNLKQKEKC